VTPHESALAEAPGRAEAASRPRRVVSSRALFGDEQEVIILHAGGEYRLRITKAGKLILTK